MTIHAMNHSDFLARIDTFLAGGLTDELAAFIAHRDTCASCAAALAEAQAADDNLRALFDSARPGADFEDRLVAKLRYVDHQPQRRRMLHPAVFRVATGVAASLLVVAIGYQSDRYFNVPAQPQSEESSVALASPASQPSNQTLAWSYGFGTSNGRGESWAERQRDVPARTLAGAGEIAQGLSHQLGRGHGSQWDAESLDDYTTVRHESMSEKGEDANEQTRLYSKALGGRRGGVVTEFRNLSEADRKPAILSTAGPVSGSGPAAAPGANSPASVIDAEKAGAPGGGGGSGGASAGTSLGLPAGGFGNGAVNGPTFGRASAGESLSAGRKDDAKHNVTNFSVDGTVPAGLITGSSELAKPAAQTPPVSARYFRLPAGGDVSQNAVDGRTKEAGVVRLSNEYFAHFDDVTGKGVKTKIDANKALEGENKLAEVPKPVTADSKAPADESKPGEKPATKDGGAAVDALVVNGEATVLKQTDEPAQVVQVAGQQVENKVAQADASPAKTASPVGPDVAAVRPVVVADQTRKIIRNGEMAFEVDSFDTSYLTIARIVQEESGFVSTTDSEKLANGKVKGTVIVRCPPERLDTLVLKLRALGELKNSKINAQDITKQFTDLEAQLRAAETMEKRLLEIVAKGTATKDLLEAEKQLGVWREKIERMTGERNYYRDQVSLSTLTITLMERDIRHAGLLEEREQVQMNVETEDVEKARTNAIQAIDQAKGRIVQSELRRHDADQFTAVIVADVAPDAAPAVIDRLKQIGRVSRLEIERKQTTPGGNPVDANNNTLPPLPNAKVERKDTRLSISLYNLANIEPRQTSSVNLAADDVEKAYRAVLEEAKSAGGRIVTSQLVRPRPDTTTGTIVFESPTEKADAVLTAVRAVADVMRLDVQQNPDTQNTTDAKRKFVVSIVSLASVPAREGTQLVVATRKVSDSFAKVRDSVREAQGRVLTSQVSQANNGQFSATADLIFEVPRDGYAAIDKALTDAGQVVSRQVTRANDTENTVDSKVRLQIRFVDEAQLNPGETVSINIAAASVNAQFSKLIEAVGAADGRILDSKLNEAEKENVTGTITFEMRRAQKASIDKALGESGDVISRNVDKTHGAPESTLEDKVRFLVTLQDSDQLPPRETARIGMESDDVNKSVGNVRNLVLASGGRTISQELAKERSGKTIAHVVADVPLSQANTVLAKLSEEGLTTSRQDSHNEQVPDGKLARMRIDLTIDNGSRIVESDQTFGSTIKKGLSTSISGLLKALYFLVVGLCFVLPIVALVWLSVKIVRRNMRTPAAGSAPTPA